MVNAGAKLSSFPEVNDIQAGDMFPLLSGGDTNAKIDYATLADAIIAKLKSETDDGVLSINGKTGVVTINKSDVGLGNVDNTSDADKPISTATQAAIDKKADKSVATESTDGLMSAADKKTVDREFFRMLPTRGTYIPPKADLNSIEYIKVGNYYNSLISETRTMKNCPAGAFIMYVLSPLNAIYDIESTDAWVYRLRIFVEYTGNIFTQLVSSDTTPGEFNYGPWTKLATDKYDIGLSNVDNTSDADKPVSTAVQNALDGKANNSVATSSADGLMSKADKAKLDGVDLSGYVKTTDISAIANTEIDTICA